MGKFTPSKNQKDIFNFILKDIRNAVISAVAGSGKTTTLLEALKLIPKDKTVLFLAFNKSIADELKTRVPKSSNIKVMTVHGFGYNTLLGHEKVEIDNGKYRKLLRSIIQLIEKKSDNFEQYDFDINQFNIIDKIINLLREVSEDVDKDKYVSDVLSLCNLGRLHLVNMDVKPIGVLDIQKLSDIHSINNQDKECEIAWYLIQLGLTIKNQIDFTDMVALPNYLNLPTDIFDFVFIDECQDLNTCQRLLMQKAIRPETGRFIAVGDPKQAIYAFAGADYESYQKLQNIPNTIELPLSVTYRCAKPIVERVSHLNPFIKHFTKNKEGVIHEEFSYKDVQENDMVLCRNTFPVVSLCIKYLSEGRRATIIGSDIGSSLIDMIKRCERKREEFNMENVFSRLYDEKEKMVEKTMTKSHMTKKEALEENHIIVFDEKIKVIEVLAVGVTDPNIVIEKIEKIFTDDSKNKGIILSNIHKSKGLESERVFILSPELLPSKYAKLPWQKEQEKNLEYVAYTRAKHTLGFIRDYDAYGGHKTREGQTVKPKQSNFVGSPGMKLNLLLKVVDIRDIKTQYGDTIVYEMEDKNGNLFTKFGYIKEDFLVDETSDSIKKDSLLNFYAEIKSHKEFKGTKTTQLGKLTQY